MLVKKWKKKISVDRRIVRLLSTSTYEDFPGAIKEMASNAYDADATEVDIKIDIKNDTIIVTDNGNGMTPDEFEFFLRIAGQQRGKQVSPEFNRKRIGQFGIGFMAVFPFGKIIKVTSTARRSDIQFKANIPTAQFIKGGQEGLSINVEDIPIPGQEIANPKFNEEHGTTIQISGLTEMVKRYFRDNAKNKKKKYSIKDKPPISKLSWMLSEDLPINYPPASKYEKIFPKDTAFVLIVRLNGEKLYRNVHAEDILEKKSWGFDNFKCRYLIATNWKSIIPFEARALKIRLKNVGIGRRRKFGLGTLGRTFSRLHWLTGEVHISEGFDKLITIDRKRFLESPEYDRFYKYFRERLSHFAYYVESVALSKREIQRQLEGDKSAEVGPRKEIIQRNIGKLESKGFEVLKKPERKSRGKSEPVKVDVGRKIVEVIEDHPALNDTILINANKIPVRYLQWDISENDFPAARQSKDGIIEINTNYPLFKSRRYGDFFKKIIVLLLVINKSTKTNEDLISRMTTQLIDEFEDLI